MPSAQQRCFQCGKELPADFTDCPSCGANLREPVARKVGWACISLGALFAFWWMFQTVNWWKSSPHPGAGFVDILPVAIPGLVGGGLAAWGARTRFGVQAGIVVGCVMLLLTALSGAALLQRNGEMIFNARILSEPRPN